MSDWLQAIDAKIRAANVSYDVVPADPFPDLHAAVRSVECPWCGQGPGERCRNPSGTTPPADHERRWAKARQAGAVLDLPCLPGCTRH